MKQRLKDTDYNQPFSSNIEHLFDLIILRDLKKY